MTAIADHASLRDAELALRTALVDNDLAALELLIDDDLVFVGPDGSTMTKPEDIAAHRSGALEFTEIRELSLSVQVFGATGVTRAALHLTGSVFGNRLDDDLVYTRAWIHRDGAWVVVAAHASLLAG